MLNKLIAAFGNWNTKATEPKISHGILSTNFDHFNFERFAIFKFGNNVNSGKILNLN